MTFASIDEAVKEIAAGRAVVVVDDEDRENEGDLIFAAEAATPRATRSTSNGRSGSTRGSAVISSSATLMAWAG